MSATVAERDGDVVLSDLRDCLRRRDDKTRHDRQFLEAPRCFSLHNINWRALSERYGGWNLVWKRFSRLSRAGVFEAFFTELAVLSKTAHLVQMLDRPVIRAHVSAAGAKGGGKAKRSADLVTGSAPRSA
jgi:transposase